MKKISVIIVTYNSENHIYDCLESLFKYNDIGDSLEVIIVDNCSTYFDVMQQKLQSLYGDRITIIQNTKNGGYGQGNNVGIRACSAPIVMIMNPDVRLIMPIFSNAINLFERNPNLVQCGLKQLTADGLSAKSLGWTTRTSPYISEVMRFICGKLDIYIPRFMYFIGSCFFVKKAAFEKVGLFDENMFMYNEEDDIHSRLQTIKKAKFYYNKSFRCKHLHPIVNEWNNESYLWMERDLDSLIYRDMRDGLDIRKTLKRAIGRTNISIWRSLNDKTRKEYFKGWKLKLIERNKSIIQ